MKKETTAASSPLKPQKKAKKKNGNRLRAELLLKRWVWMLQSEQFYQKWMAFLQNKKNGTEGFSQLTTCFRFGPNWFWQQLSETLWHITACHWVVTRGKPYRSRRQEAFSCSCLSWRAVKNSDWSIWMWQRFIQSPSKVFRCFLLTQ